MNSITKQIQELNKIYSIMQKNYVHLQKIFHNHKQIKDTIILSEQFLMQSFGMIVEKSEQIMAKRTFNKIIKDIKETK